MKCNHCHSENPAGFSFCGHCGRHFDQTCPRCNAQIPVTFLFCGLCGLALDQKSDRLTSADIDHLRAYLPTNLVEALQLEMAQPPVTLWQQCINHLARLLKATASHLPAYLVEQVAQQPVPGQTHGRFITGTLLFADISGFTAMSERLSRIGREGAEEVTTIINRYYDVMLAILRQYNGQLIKFGGDALLGLFAEPAPPLGETGEGMKGGDGGVARAIQAALQMQAAMAEFAETQTSQGTFPLQMKVAIHHGRFFAAQLGTAQSMEYALFGTDVNKTATLESVAAAGQIVTDRLTLAMVDAQVTATSSSDNAPDKPVPDLSRYPVQAVPLDEHHLLIEAAPPWPLPELPPPLQLLPDLVPDLPTLRRAVKLLDTLTPYLPSGLLSRLAGPPSIPPGGGDERGGDLGGGEHRLVAVLFSNLHGMGDIADQLGPGHEHEIIEALNRIFVAFTTALERYGGVINKIDLYDHGDKFLAFFGAPIAHEDDAERAVRTALQIEQAIADLNKILPHQIGLPDLHLEQHIGISYGYVFAGYVGADWRREYTVMGDEVNLAARLMATSEAGRITVSRSIQRKVQALFDLPSRGEMQLKGKENPIPIYDVAGLRAVPEPLRGLKGMVSPLVGREAEWRLLREALAQLVQERGQIASVMGEAGLGKSRLVAELRRLTAENLQFAHIGWVEGRCLSYTENVSYWPFQEALQRLVHLTPDDDQDMAITKLHQALEQWLSPAAAWDMLPYLANFLNLELPEELQVRVRYLDAEALQRRTFLALRTLLKAQAEKIPLILVLDDLHWLDNASARLL
jgi:class 3 adenylate cyclase